MQLVGLLFWFIIFLTLALGRLVVGQLPYFLGKSIFYYPIVVFYYYYYGLMKNWMTYCLKLRCSAAAATGKHLHCGFQ